MGWWRKIKLIFRNTETPLLLYIAKNLSLLQSHTVKIVMWIWIEATVFFLQWHFAQTFSCNILYHATALSTYDTAY